MINNWFYKQTNIGAQESKAQRELKRALDGAHNRRIIRVAEIVNCCKGPTVDFYMQSINKDALFGRERFARNFLISLILALVIHIPISNCSLLRWLTRDA